MPSRDGSACGSCKHFHARPDVSRELGECRLNPPRPMQEPRQTLQGMTMVVTAYYPPVHVGENWCAQWQAGGGALSVAN